MKKIEVSAAILVRENKILCAQRNIGKYEYVSKKYEFPGGKIELGESPKAALHRELIEEMDISISREDMLDYCVVEHQYPDFFVRMHCFICPVGEEKINLKEHIEGQWRSIDTMSELDWAQADLPVVEKLIKEGL